MIAFAALTMVCSAHADTVTLSNGDRVTGMIVKSDGKELTIQTESAGMLTVKWPDVRQITSSGPIYVVNSQGQAIGGVVTTEGGDLVVTPSSGAPQRIPLASATAIRSQAEETKYEASLHPGVLQSWATNGSVGFALARGNSHTTNLNIGFNATRATLHDKLVAYADSIYASSGLLVTPGVTAGVTANDIRGGLMYQHDISTKIFAFGSADFEYNELQFLNLRSILTLGGGYHAIKTPTTTLDLLAGANYTRESYSTVPPLVRSVAALTVGDSLKYQMSQNTIVNQTLEIYPELSHAGQYRFAFDLSFVTKIRQWIGWQNTVSERYISDPIPGTVANDFIFSTGFNFTFTH